MKGVKAFNIASNICNTLVNSETIFGYDPDTGGSVNVAILVSVLKSKMKKKFIERILLRLRVGKLKQNIGKSNIELRLINLYKVITHLSHRYYEDYKRLPDWREMLGLDVREIAKKELIAKVVNLFRKSFVEEELNGLCAMIEAYDKDIDCRLLTDLNGTLSILAPELIITKECFIGHLMEEWIKYEVKEKQWVEDLFGKYDTNKDGLIKLNKFKLLITELNNEIEYRRISDLFLKVKY